MHTQRTLDLVGVVCNGGTGDEPAARAALARCVLDTLGATAVPVAVGSSGQPYAPLAHEYALDGYTAAAARVGADGARPLGRGAELIERVLRGSPAGSLTIVCISSLRDLADALRADGGLVRERVCRVAIMGGLERDPGAPHGYVPDTSVNNEFDREAAACVYGWCFTHGLPMSVVSRHAVPLLPMQLARSFAERTECPVMRYLADAQFFGLCGL
jgi:inosine-uridine nucleoside N-ribohydrolase